MKILEETAAIIRQSGKILICQRPADTNCGLLWEFPGGKIEAGETGEQCIICECQEELGITLSVEFELTDITYEYPHCIEHLEFLPLPYHSRHARKEGAQRDRVDNSWRGCSV